MTNGKCIFLDKQQENNDMTAPPEKMILYWSGGKDSALSLYHLLREGRYDIRYLFTTLDPIERRISMHGVREELLYRQAAALGIPLKTLLLPENSDMQAYDSAMSRQLKAFAGEGITHAAIGDIFLEDLKQYRERQLLDHGIKGVFPLWGKDSDRIVTDFLDAGFKAVVSCAGARWLDRSFAGRTLDEAFIRDLPAGVDPCGENGEYHSFVFDGPLFSRPVSYSLGKIVEKEYPSGDNQWDNRFFFRDLLP